MIKEILIVILISLLLAPIGIISHNYEVKKCELVEVNQYYEAQADCYMALNRPSWHLFWEIFSVFILSLMLCGFGVFIIAMVKDFKENAF